jgi:hypothetical protein
MENPEIEYKVLPVSVIDIAAAGMDKKRGEQDHNKQSSRASHSPFPEEVCDLCYEFFLRGKKQIIDPFAGWGERHKKAKEYGKQYWGVDCSQEAIRHAKEVNGVENYFGDARREVFPDHDGLLTCPPYWNLEVYQGGGLDRAKTWQDFLLEYEIALDNCMKRAMVGATYCFFVGDWRKNSVYYPLTFETQRLFYEKGWKCVDTVVFSRKGISKIKIMLPQAKRLGYTVKVHENLLVFSKT